MYFELDPSNLPSPEAALGLPTALLQEHFLPVSGIPAPQLLAALRCCVMTPEDLAQAKAERWDAVQCKPLSPQNEQVMLAALQQLLQAMLQVSVAHATKQPELVDTCSWSGGCALAITQTSCDVRGDSRHAAGRQMDGLDE